MPGCLSTSPHSLATMGAGNNRTARFVHRSEFRPTFARSAPLDRRQNAPYDRRRRDNSELEGNQPLERQPPGYALLKMDLQTKASSLDPRRVEHVEGSNPAHQAQIRSHVALSRGMGWDASAYFTGKLADLATRRDRRQGFRE